MDAHYNFVTISVYMALCKGHRFGEDVITGANQVHVENLVVSYQTKDSLVKVAHITRRERYYNALR